MDYEKIANAANSIDSAIRDNAALKSIIIDASSAVIGDSSNETKQSIQDFLDSPLGDKKEIVMKKAFAAAMILAKEKELLPDLPDTGAAIAAVVDEGLTRIKANYQVGIGLLDPELAIDHIVDHVESRAIAYVDQAFDSGTVREVATEGVIRFAYAIPAIGPIIGPIAENYKPIIKSVISKVEEPVKNAIKTGVHFVATTAKNMAHEAIEKAKSIAKNVAKKFASWLS